MKKVSPSSLVLCVSYLAFCLLIGCQIPGGHCSITPPPTVPHSGLQTSHPDASVQQATHISNLRPPEQLSFLSQQLASSEDDRKVLLARLQMADNRLHEHDQVLQVTAEEIRRSKDAVQLSRLELQRCKLELESIRDKLRSSERQHVQILESIISTLEHLLQDQDSMLHVHPSGPKLGGLH